MAESVVPREGCKEKMNRDLFSRSLKPVPFKLSQTAWGKRVRTESPCVSTPGNVGKTMYGAASRNWADMDSCRSREGFPIGTTARA